MVKENKVYGQKEYEGTMADATATRTTDSKLIVTKKAAKAELVSKFDDAKSDKLAELVSKPEIQAQELQDTRSLIEDDKKQLAGPTVPCETRMQLDGIPCGIVAGAQDTLAAQEDGYLRRREMQDPFGTVEGGQDNLAARAD